MDCDLTWFTVAATAPDDTLHVLLLVVLVLLVILVIIIIPTVGHTGLFRPGLEKEFRGDSGFGQGSWRSPLAFGSVAH